MHRARRRLAGLAVLAVVVYGIAPALANVRRAAPPAMCLAEAVHRCACGADHDPSACCCAEENAADRMTCAPCGQQDAGKLAALWTTSDPLHAQAARPRVDAPRSAARVGELIVPPASRRAADVPTPPPRAPVAA